MWRLSDDDRAGPDHQGWLPAVRGYPRVKA